MSDWKKLEEKLIGLGEKIMSDKSWKEYLEEKENGILPPPPPPPLSPPPLGRFSEDRYEDYEEEYEDSAHYLLRKENEKNKHMLISIKYYLLDSVDEEHGSRAELARELLSWWKKNYSEKSDFRDIF